MAKQQGDVVWIPPDGGFPALPSDERALHYNWYGVDAYPLDTQRGKGGLGCCEDDLENRLTS